MNKLSNLSQYSLCSVKLTTHYLHSLYKVTNHRPNGRQAFLVTALIRDLKIVCSKTQPPQGSAISSSTSEARFLFQSDHAIGHIWPPYMGIL